MTVEETRAPTLRDRFAAARRADQPAGQARFIPATGIDEVEVVHRPIQLKIG